jgi:hypothetical protein
MRYSGSFAALPMMSQHAMSTAAEMRTIASRDHPFSAEIRFQVSAKSLR